MAVDLIYRVRITSGSAVDYSHPDCQCQGDLHDEKCERNKPIVFARCTRYGLAKSRSASSATPPSASAHHLPLRQQQQQTTTSSSRRLPQTTLSRDYSIDERTDALFREFSRCDPVYEQGQVVAGKQHQQPFLLRPGGFNRTRWINQQQPMRFLSRQNNGGGDLTTTSASSSMDTADGVTAVKD